MIAYVGVAPTQKVAANQYYRVSLAANWFAGADAPAHTWDKLASEALVLPVSPRPPEAGLFANADVWVVDVRTTDRTGSVTVEQLGARINDLSYVLTVTRVELITQQHAADPGELAAQTTQDRQARDAGGFGGQLRDLLDKFGKWVVIVLVLVLAVALVPRLLERK